MLKYWVPLATVFFEISSNRSLGLVLDPFKLPIDRNLKYSQKTVQVNFSCSWADQHLDPYVNDFGGQMEHFKVIGRSYSYFLKVVKRPKIHSRTDYTVHLILRKTFCVFWPPSRLDRKINDTSFESLFKTGLESGIKTGKTSSTVCQYWFEWKSTTFS